MPLLQHATQCRPFKEANAAELNTSTFKAHNWKDCLKTDKEKTLSNIEYRYKPENLVPLPISETRQSFVKGSCLSHPATREM